ncbi:MAG: diguanylate cyclase [Pseudomonadota bacterium]
MTQRTELRSVDPNPPSGVQMPRSEFRRIVDALIDGVIIIDARGSIMRANPAVEAILGYSEEDLLGENVSIIMTDEDRHAHDGYLARYEQSGNARIIGVGREVNGRHKDGTLVPIELSVTPAFINDQTMYVGLLRDITERREYEARFELNNRIMRAVNQALGNVINEGMSTREVFDTALEDLLDVTHSEYGFIGEIKHRDDLPYLQTHAITNIAWNHETRKFYRDNVAKGLEFTNLNTLFGVTIRSGQRVISDEPADDHRRGGLPKGHPPLNSYLGVPIYSGSKLLGMAGIANRRGGYSEELADEIKPLLNAFGTLIAAHQSTVTRIKAEETLFKTQQQLKQMATKDPVTGISNRYMIVQELEMHYERSLKGDLLSVLFLDVDHFKQVNDTHGHDVGDKVLRHIAEIISEALRPSDSVGRYGGEEFLVGLPGCGTMDALRIADRIRREIEEVPYSSDAVDALSLSASIGVAGVSERPQDLEELIRFADEAVYAAKEKGRNCVVAYERKI